MRHAADAAAAYRAATFENAPPIKILNMLYEGAIRFLRHAQELEPGSVEYRKFVRRADDILGELRASLDHEPNADVAGNLDRLYVFSQGELSAAYLESEGARIQPVIEVLETLLQGWKGAQTQLAAQHDAA
ncbi:MAG: flagellar export chaperone FliS [Planctomycetes bacterium]|nr:flagellar export chaperone FliS [Planctomycetota bacterium]